MPPETVSWQDFERVELRVGTVIAVTPFPEARKPAYIIDVDFGPEIGRKLTSAQVTDNYSRHGLIGRQVLGVVNFPAKQIGQIHSEFLLTGFYRPDGSVILAVPDKDVPNGAKLG